MLMQIKNTQVNLSRCISKRILRNVSKRSHIISLRTFSKCTENRSHQTFLIIQYFPMIAQLSAFRILWLNKL